MSEGRRINDKLTVEGFTKGIDLMRKRATIQDSKAWNYVQKWPREYRRQARDLYLAYGPAVTDTIMEVICQAQDG